MVLLITNGGHVFIGCSFDNSATPYSISVKYTRNVTLIGCNFQVPDASDSGTKIQNINSDVTILNPVQSVLPDPAYGQWKTLTSWITGSDYPYKNYGIIPKPSSIDNGNIYVRDIDIHVVEAFDNTSGTFAVLQTGVEYSAQYFAQGVDLLSTGVKEITWNNRGYYSTNNEFFRGTIVTDGAIDETKGKAIVTITYIEVPVQP